MLDYLNTEIEKPIFIDFEASSINGYPIQVAYGSCEEDLKCFLIKPLTSWNNAEHLWSFDSQEIHGFSKNHINEYGINAKSVAREVSDDLNGKAIYADSKADMTWLYMLLDDVARITCEDYPKPDFKLISTLAYEQKISSSIAVKAQIKAEEKFKAYGLIAHKADADVLKHIWTWEAVQELKDNNYE